MLVSILAMMGFNLIDAFFLGQLGTLPLAAITLTFPVVMVVGTFTLGLGVGAMAAISKGIGAGQKGQIRRYATDALTLAGLFVGMLTLIGLATVEPLFRLLGATDSMMPLVRQYMLIWYPGMIFYVVPMIGNNIIRATGDTATPSVVMLVGVALNAALDPLLIFGWGPIPSLGMGGAALASVVSRGVTLALTFWVLCFRERLLVSPWPGRMILLASWKTILRIGLPVAVSNAIIPVALGLITRIVGRFGEGAVAGFGVATRMESFGLAVIIALSTGMSPFVGQNFGAGRIDRIQGSLRFAKIFALSWGAMLALVFLLFGRQMATLFNPDPAVVQSARLYLWIVPVSQGLRGLHQVNRTSLNVLNRPYDSLFLEFLLAFGLWIPLGLTGAHIGQIAGLYGGLALANTLAGIAAIIWVDRVVKRESLKSRSTEVAGERI
jgi:putative MATE family efflux protein